MKHNVTIALVLFLLRMNKKKDNFDTNDNRWLFTLIKIYECYED